MKPTLIALSQTESHKKGHATTISEIGKVMKTPFKSLISIGKTLAYAQQLGYLTSELKNGTRNWSYTLTAKGLRFVTSEEAEEAPEAPPQPSPAPDSSADFDLGIEVTMFLHKISEQTGIECVNLQAVQTVVETMQGKLKTIGDHNTNFARENLRLGAELEVMLNMVSQITGIQYDTVGQAAEDCKLIAKQLAAIQQPDDTARYDYIVIASGGSETLGEEEAHEKARQITLGGTNRNGIVCRVLGHYQREHKAIFMPSAPRDVQDAG